MAATAKSSKTAENGSGSAAIMATPTAPDGSGSESAARPSSLPPFPHSASCTGLPCSPPLQTARSEISPVAGMTPFFLPELECGQLAVGHLSVAPGEPGAALDQVQLVHVEGEDLTGAGGSLV
jgi:hypothetical protein